MQIVLNVTTKLGQSKMDDSVRHRNSGQYSKKCILFEQATMQKLHTSQTMSMLCNIINTDCNPLFYYLGYTCE